MSLQSQGGKLVTTQNGKLQFDQAANRLVFFDGTANSFFLGVDNSGNFVGKLAQAGNDALTAPDNLLIWSTLLNSFKIVATGVATVNKPASNWFGSTYVQFSTALARTPAMLGYMSSNGNLEQLPYVVPVQTGFGADNGKIALQVKIANITNQGFQIICYTPDMSGGSFGNTNYNQSIDIDVRWYALVETAATS